MTFKAEGKKERMLCYDPNIKLTAKLNPSRFLNTNTNSNAVYKLSIYWKSAALLSLWISKTSTL